MTDNLESRLLAEVERALGDEPHDVDCPATRERHAFGCAFDGSLVGEEFDTTRNELCTCVPYTGPCECVDERLQRLARRLARMMAAYGKVMRRGNSIIEIDEDGVVHDPLVDEALRALAAAREAP